MLVIVPNVRWSGIVVVEGVWIIVIGDEVVVVTRVGIVVVVGMGAWREVVGLELIFNLSRSTKSFCLSGEKLIGLLSWAKLKPSK